MTHPHHWRISSPSGPTSHGGCEATIFNVVNRKSWGHI